jgi:prefoldin subunit 5
LINLGTHSYIKDIILISALLVSIGACLYAFIRHRQTQESMNMMLRELESLQKAGGDLIAVTGK